MAPEPSDFGQPEGFPVGLGQPLGRVLGGDAQLVAQVGGSGGRGGQALYGAGPVLGFPGRQ